MQATTVVEGDPVCDSCLGLAAVGIALEIDVLMLERPPQPKASAKKLAKA